MRSTFASSSVTVRPCYVVLAHNKCNELCIYTCITVKHLAGYLPCNGGKLNDSEIYSVYCVIELK